MVNMGGLIALAKHIDFQNILRDGLLKMKKSLKPSEKCCWNTEPYNDVNSYSQINYYEYGTAFNF